MLLVGAGLILLGLAAFILLPKYGTNNLTGGADAGRTADEASVIPVEVDFPAPDLRLVDLLGNPVGLSNHLGEWVLLNSWATWCPPCKAEMPTLQAYYDDHRAQNFTLIAIEQGAPVEKVANYVKKNDLHITIWPDPEQKTYQAFRNISLPTSWVIDPQGQIRLTWVGAITRDVLEKYVTPLLKE